LKQHSSVLKDAVVSAVTALFRIPLVHMNVVNAIALRICISKRIQNGVIIFAIYFQAVCRKTLQQVNRESRANPLP